MGKYRNKFFTKYHRFWNWNFIYHHSSKGKAWLAKLSIIEEIRVPGEHQRLIHYFLLCHWTARNPGNGERTRTVSCNTLDHSAMGQPCQSSPRIIELDESFSWNLSVDVTINSQYINELPLNANVTANDKSLTLSYFSILEKEPFMNKTLYAEYWIYWSAKRLYLSILTHSSIADKGESLQDFCNR